jgi:N-acetylneuraminic acid mutarotase
MRTLLITAILFYAQIGLSQEWTSISSLPTVGRDDGLAFSISGFGYVTTGKLNGFTESNKLFQYNPSSDVWIEKAVFPGTARQYSSVFVLDNKAFLIGGYSENGQALNDVWCYNPFTDSWTQKNNFPSLPRWHSTALSIQNKAFFGMGASADSTLSDFWKYDSETDTWDRMADYPGGAMRSVLGIPIQNKGIFGEGFSVNPITYSTSWFQFDTKLEEWSVFESFPGGTRAYGTTVSNGLSALVCGGMDEDGTISNDCYSIDYSGKWTELAPLPNSGLKGMKGFYIDGTFYLGTGIDQNSVRTSNFYKMGIAEFDPHEITLFPNPSKNDFTVVTQPGATVFVYTINGHLLKQLEVPETGFVMIEGLSIGVYVLSIEGNDLFEIRKIVRV